MGFLDSITNSVKSLIGTKKSGGSRDAFSSFSNFLGKLKQDVPNYLGQVQGLQDQFKSPLLNYDTGMFDSIRGSIEGSRGLLNNLQTSLIQQAMSGAANAGITGVQNARYSGGGRYGLAFGGGAGGIAERTATAASVGQSQALSQALTQGQIANAQHQTTINSQLLQNEAARINALGMQSQIGEGRLAQRLGVVLSPMHAALGLSNTALGTGLGNDASAMRNRTALTSNILQLLSEK